MAKAAQEFNVNLKSSRSDYRSPPSDEQIAGEQSSAPAEDEWFTFDKPMIYLLCVMYQNMCDTAALNQSFAALENHHTLRGKQQNDCRFDFWLTCFSRDLMQFPVARASDGFIDIVAQEVVSGFHTSSEDLSL